MNIISLHNIPGKEKGLGQVRFSSVHIFLASKIQDLTIEIYRRN